MRKPEPQDTDESRTVAQGAAVERADPARRRVRHRKALMVSAAIAATCVGAWLVGLPSVTGVRQFHEGAGMAATGYGVHFRSDVPTVTVRPSKDDAVHVTANGEYSGSRPLLSVRQEDDHVLVLLDCYVEAGRICTMSVNLYVPTDQPFTGLLSDGSFDVRGLSKPVNLSTESGMIRLRDVSGSVAVSTLTGTVSGSGLKGERFSVSTQEGPVSLVLARSPASMWISTRGGAVSVRMPESSYRFAKSGSGKVTMRLPQSHTAFGLITVDAQAGSVVLLPSRGSQP